MNDKWTRMRAQMLVVAARFVPTRQTQHHGYDAPHTIELEVTVDAPSIVHHNTNLEYNDSTRTRINHIHAAINTVLVEVRETNHLH